MTIRIEGKIAVKTVSGKNGNFSVGDLTTGIGDFKGKRPTVPIICHTTVL